MITLRDYQQSAADEIRKAYREGYKAPILVAPTGSGKTVLFSYIAHHAGAKGNNVLILVHRKELLEQTSATLDAFDVEHGLIAPRRTFSYARIQVASVQTLIRRIDKLPWTPSMIIIDEAHHVTKSTTWGKVVAAYPGVPILGVTATPERLDGSGLGVHADGFFDTMVYGPPVADLVDRGYLAKPMVYAPPIGVDLSSVKMQGGDFKNDELAEVMDTNSITGDAVEHYRKYSHKKPAIAFCANIEHAEHVAERFSAAGYNAASVDGTMTPADRSKRIWDLGNGKLDVLTSCMIISEGTDIPVVHTAIMLRPTASVALALQQMGRALRPYEGKEHAVILDHAGNCLRHGLPDADREWSLDAKKRNKREKTDEIQVSQCPECYFVHEKAPECPACGHVYETKRPDNELKEVDGDLQLLTDENSPAARREELKRARTFDDLVLLGEKRGYKAPRKWAYATRIKRVHNFKQMLTMAHELRKTNPHDWAAYMWSNRNV